MLKATPTLLLLLLATGGVLSHSSVDADANISISPFNPIGFTRFILYMISLPFRIIGMVFGGSFGGGFMMGSGSGSGTEVGERNSGGIFDGLFALPRGIARFIEEIFHLVRIFLDTIFGHLEGGAAVVAGDGFKSQSNRDIRNNNATRAEAAQAG